MPVNLLNDKKAPYCPGCGHNSVNHLLDQVIVELDLDPLDITVVSDIGCCGLIDSQLTSHTVHGLHGRSSALASGISLGLNDPKKKVITVMGDGGATIGLQHILEGARQNIDLTVLVLNNMVYGMTGGQLSGLSTSKFREEKLHEIQVAKPYDICSLAYHAGATYCVRTFVGKDLKAILTNAIGNNGFSLIEIIDMCPSYGEPKVKGLRNLAEYKEITLTKEREPNRLRVKEYESLFKKTPSFAPQFESSLKNRLEIIIAGSAGEGIQSAADLLASAGILAGLNTTKKGEYPITVGTGFSIAEVICSREEVHYTGLNSPDIIFVLSEDGLSKVKHLMNSKSLFITDESLDITDDYNIKKGNFRKEAGKKGAALCAIASWVNSEKPFPIEALLEAAKSSRHAESFIDSIKAGINL